MVSKEEAKKYLCDAAPEQCFWVNNGPILKNMEEAREKGDLVSTNTIGIQKLDKTGYRAF